MIHEIRKNEKSKLIVYFRTYRIVQGVTKSEDRNRIMISPLQQTNHGLALQIKVKTAPPPYAPHTATYCSGQQLFPPTQP